MSSEPSPPPQPTSSCPGTPPQETGGSLMRRALTLMSTKEACKAGLGSDASLLLLLVLDPSVLESQVPVGRCLLDTLASLDVRHDAQARAALVHEVQECMLGSDEHWESIWEHKDAIANVFNSAKKGRKGDVLNAFEQQADRAGRRAYYPSLLQIVYRSGSRVHVLLNRWSHALCAMCTQLGSGSSIESILEVPNPLQRTLKPYVDWDMKLSTIEQSQFFESFTEREWLASKRALAVADDPAAPWQVNFARYLGLCVPAVVCAMLRDMGCVRAAGDVHVVVKEGTRQVADKDGAADWKISFHFIFQVTVSLAQFKCVYEMLTAYLAASGARLAHAQDLAFLLGQVPLRQYEAHLASSRKAARTSKSSARPCLDDKCKDEAARTSQSSARPCLDDQERDDECRDEAALRRRALRRLLAGSWGAPDAAQCTAALVGMDMHPRRNAEQGLACLGSRKTGVARGNRLLGMMRVDACACAWVPDYGAKTHRLLVAAECSILAPGPRCIALEPMHAWNPAPWEPGASASHLRGSRGDGGCGADDASVQSCLRRMAVADERALAQCRALRAPAAHGQSTASLMHALKRCAAARDGGCFSVACAPTSESKAAVFEALPQWFRACADDIYKKKHGGASFEAAFGRSANTSMAALQRISLPHILAPRRAECKLVHVARAEICVCSLSLLRIRFEGFKCHNKNGVIFCVHGERVFVTCMDKDCESELRLNGRAYYLMSKVIEENIFAPSNTTRRAPSAPREPGSGPTPSMPPEEPARAAGVASPAASCASPCASSASGSGLPPSRGVRMRDLHSLAWGDVPAVLSASQLAFLNEVAATREGLLLAGTGHKFHLRDFCKVPWRNIWGSERGERIWVELTEPMLRSYASWRTGSIQTQGFGAFVSKRSDAARVV